MYVSINLSIFQKINLMTINAMKMYLDECSKDKHLELKNLDDTQEINKLYVSANNIISAYYDIIKHFK